MNRPIQNCDDEWVTGAAIRVCTSVIDLNCADRLEHHRSNTCACNLFWSFPAFLPLLQTGHRLWRILWAFLSKITVIWITCMQTRCYSAYPLSTFSIHSLYHWIHYQISTLNLHEKGTWTEYWFGSLSFMSIHSNHPIKFLFFINFVLCDVSQVWK
jgi:hypothetical protein